MILGWWIIGFGVLFLFLGSLGVYRMPDIYNRLQAGTKCTTLGAFCSIIGVGIVEPSWFWTTLIIAVFILLTNPISSHALGRASCLFGVSFCKKTKINQAGDFCKGEKDVS